MDPERDSEVPRRITGPWGLVTAPVKQGLERKPRVGERVPNWPEHVCEGRVAKTDA